MRLALSYQIPEQNLYIDEPRICGTSMVELTNALIAVAPIAEALAQVTYHMIEVNA